MGDADRELAVGPEDRTRREATGAGGRRAVHVVEQPLVGPELSVEPHHMVEARHHEALRSGHPVRHRRGAEQREIRHVGARGRVHERVVGQGAVDAQPHVLVGSRRRRRGRPVVATPGTACRWARIAGDPRRGSIGVLLVRPRRRHRERRGGSGDGTSGIGVAVIGAALVDVERGGHVEDRLAVLDRDDASGREAPPVADAVDVEDDRHLRVARRRKYAWIECTTPIGLDRAAGGLEALRQHLPAEDPLAPGRGSGHGTG